MLVLATLQYFFYTETYKTRRITCLFTIILEVCHIIKLDLNVDLKLYLSTAAPLENCQKKSHYLGQNRIFWPFLLIFYHKCLVYSYQITLGFWFHFTGRRHGPHRHRPWAIHGSRRPGVLLPPTESQDQDSDTINTIVTNFFESFFGYIFDTQSSKDS